MDDASRCIAGTAGESVIQTDGLMPIRCWVLLMGLEMDDASSSASSILIPPSCHVIPMACLGITSFSAKSHHRITTMTLLHVKRH